MFNFGRLFLIFITVSIVCGNNSRNFLFELKGKIDDCFCTIDTVDQFNNAKIYPRISSIILKDYFRFYKVNLKKSCPFWKDGSRCDMRYCQVESCNEELVPPGLKIRQKQHHENENMSLKYTESGNEFDCDEVEHQDLGYLNTTISISTLEDFVLWQAYDDAQDLYCTLPDEDGEAQYVDLKLNPERYTGYGGKYAHRIWLIIYKENCFRPENIFEVYVRSSKLTGMCLEKRAFYRAISGLHSSINIHLSAQYLLSDKNNNLLSDCSTGRWGPNIEELNHKFAPEFTNGEGPQWIRNLYFLYLLELRALVKASVYLEQEEYFTGNEKEDTETRKAINNFLLIVKSFPHQFNESSMFKENLDGKSLKEEFRKHFRNISMIMDCVGCDKCKLWGKLQTQGLGTAFKILFSEKLDKLLSSNINRNVSLKKKSFQLKRSEIVALFNGFARLSTSIYELENFRNMMQ
ncbi:hypothetical protein PGB90_001495 [Kerria lacca]